MAAITRVVGNSPSLTAITLPSFAYGGATVGFTASPDLHAPGHQRQLAGGLGTQLKHRPTSRCTPYMCRTDVDSRGWLVLGPALRAQAPSLQSLQLPGFALGVEGTAAVVPALQALTGLPRLVCTLTAADVAAAGHALMSMRRLKVLHLRASWHPGHGYPRPGAALIRRLTYFPVPTRLRDQRGCGRERTGPCARTGAGPG